MSSAALETPSPPTPTDEAAPWTRLSIRVVYIDLLRVAVSLTVGWLGVVVFDGGPVRPLLIAAAVGVLGALLDFRRWMTTRFRVTGERVELRTGWVSRRHRTVPRDRVRSVDSSATLRHRLFGVRVVHIGSGEADTSFKLDALSIAAAETLQRELMSSVRDDHRPADDDTARAQPQTVIAGLRWQWVAYSAANLWAPFVVAAPLFGAYVSLRPFGVDLLAVAEGLLDWQTRGVAWVVAVCVAVAIPLGVAVLAVTFLIEYWNFALLRIGTPPATALLTRKGLLTTRTTHRDDRRIRGVAIVEPLVWRWLRLADTHVVTTGLGRGGESAPGGRILPRTTLPEARRLAGDVLPDGRRPLDAPLHRHPRGALVRRLLMAGYIPLGAAGGLALLGATGAIPDTVWPVPLALLPVTVPLALLAYRSLGHTVAGPYLVLRRGAVRRRTVALHRRAVIGWTVKQSVFQRWGGRVTVGTATAAGNRYYEASDAGLDQALALIHGADPGLAAQFLTGTPALGHDRQRLGQSLQHAAAAERPPSDIDDH